MSKLFDYDATDISRAYAAARTRDPLTALRECARVLSSSGHLLVINATVDILDSVRWLPFFPSAREIDLARLPSRTQRSEVAREAGLHHRTSPHTPNAWRAEHSRRFS